MNQNKVSIFLFFRETGLVQRARLFELCPYTNSWLAPGRSVGEVYDPQTEQNKSFERTRRVVRDK